MEKLQILKSINLKYNHDPRVRACTYDIPTIKIDFLLY